MDTTENIPDHLRCPICIEVPKAKVFQCRRGHILCEACYSKLSSCPTCRLHFEGEPIRTLVIEKVLDDLNLEFECPHKNAGCDEMVHRTTLQSHMDSCDYNPTRVGAFVNLCRTKFGFNNCTFQVNKENVPEAIKHFKSVHGVAVGRVRLLDYMGAYPCVKPK